MSLSSVSVGSQGPPKRGIDCCPRELGATTALVAPDPVAGVLLPCVPEAFMSWVPLSSSTSIQSPRRLTPGPPRGQQPPAVVSEGASFSRGGVTPLTVSILFLPRKPRAPLPAVSTACPQERPEEPGPSRDRSSTLCTIVYAWPCFSSVKWGHRRKAFISENLKSSAGRGLLDPRPRLAWDLTGQLSLPE